MKKLGAFLVGASLVAGAAVWAANTATSVNAVGFVNVTVPSAGKLTLLGVPFVAIGTNGVGLETILGTNQLRSATFYTAADRVLLWSSLSSAYSFYAIKSTDMKFHNAGSAALWVGAATNPIVYPGDGLWVWSPAASSSNITVSMAGEVVSSSNSTVYIQPGLNLLSHQFSSDLDVNNSNLTNSQAVSATFYTTADKIYTWDNSAQSYNTWALKTADRKWHYANSAAQWVGGPVSNLIRAGEGFWYSRATNTVMTWSEDSKYYNNLH